MRNLLIVEDEASVRTSYRVLFAERYRLWLAETVAQALGVLDAQTIDLVLLDLTLPDRNGLELLRALAATGRKVPVIVVTATNSVEAAVAAVKQGAVEFLVKPFDIARLRELVDQTLAPKPLSLRDASGQVPPPFQALIGEAPRFLAALERARRSADVVSTVLLAGESGTGKDLLARAMHEAGPRMGGPFVPLSCAAIPDTLVEAELFGHVRGAFTGAIENRPGKLAAADGGTLFLDEIGEMPLEAQAKLLRVLQAGAFYPVGGHDPVAVDVRFICATHRDLREEVARGRFREDLYYRVHVLPIQLPPLRERREDIPRLAQHFLGKHRARVGASAAGFAPRALARLYGYPWPGNVRELENVIERVLVLHRDAPLIQPEHLDALDLAGEAAPPNVLEAFAGMGLNDATRHLERQLIAHALREADGVQSRAAALLGTTRRVLKYKMDQLEMRAPDQGGSLAG